MRPSARSLYLCTAIAALVLPGGHAGAAAAMPDSQSRAPAPVALQGDPRIAIPGSRTPAPPFEVDEPGSYILTGDRLCAGDGIRVRADDVTTEPVDTLGNGFFFRMAGNYFANNKTSGNTTGFAGEVLAGTGDGCGNLTLPHHEPEAVPAASPAASPAARRARSATPTSIRPSSTSPAIHAGAAPPRLTARIRS